MMPANFRFTLLLLMPCLNNGFIFPSTSLQLPTIPGPGRVVSHHHNILTAKSTTSAINNKRNIMMMNAAASSSSSSSLMPQSSLASSYAVRIYPSNNGDDECNGLKWELHSLNQWALPNDNEGEGTLALRALSDCAQGGDRTDAAFTLSCEWNPSDSDNPSDPNCVDAWSIHVSVVSSIKEEDVPHELLCVLSRIMVQSAASEIASKQITDRETLLRITLPLLEGEGCQQLLLSDIIFPTEGKSSSSANGGDYDPNSTGVGVRQLFTPLNSQYANMEIVDMVNNEGRVLGSLPRPYVHTWNILHRGIGMIVSKDVDIFEALLDEDDNAEKTMPEVYVHQRTSTKRIFPSLYDMFVGGVSSSGEDAKWTAAREVAEELGLTRALNVLENNQKDVNSEAVIVNPLSDKLFQCTVCTSYNRCVVSMFTYCCDTALESITWQEEEVAWGDYVPYDIVQLAGDMSIDRLMEKGIWPGSSCKDDDCGKDVDGAKSELTIEKLKTKYDKDYSWDTWDFVPDGLLVWEAWKAFLS